MSDREYEAWCGTCANHWYLRLRRITEVAPLVRCPRCGSDGVANLLPPVRGPVPAVGRRIDP